MELLDLVMPIMFSKWICFTKLVYLTVTAVRWI